MYNNHFKNILQRLSLCCILMLANIAYADFKIPSIDDKFVVLTEANPERDAGYVVGDKLTRTITLTILKPYELVTETLPIVGYEHKFKGQKSGIELAEIHIEKVVRKDDVSHTIDLTYQVFTTSKLAKPASLRAEFVKIRNLNTKKVVQYRIPSWNFRISPLSVFGSVKLDKEMSTYIKPLQIDSSKIKTRLTIALSVLAAALLGLLYILGVRAWLPRMGAPFAKAYRDLKKLPDTNAGLQQAVSRIHTSLNQTAGASVFNDNLAEFITQKPQFSPAKQEIEAFFKLSRYTFFEVAGAHTLDTNAKSWLIELCRHLRDCERGLNPDIQSKAGQG